MSRFFPDVTASFRGPRLIHHSAWLTRALVVALLGSIALDGQRNTSAAQTSGNRVAAEQSEQEIRRLERNKPIERELAGGQRHTYRIELVEGQYFSLAVEQRGIDVAVLLFGPDGKQLAEADSERRKQGAETVSQVTETAGGYRLEVQAKEKDAAAAGYEIRVVELRAATENERALQEARKLNANFLRLYRAGKYEEARSSAERALGIHEKALGPDHPEVAISLNQLAVIYKDNGNYAEAEPLNRRALAIREKALGPDHPDVAQSLTSLAIFHSATGENAKAEPLLLRALAIREKAFGPEHPNTAAALNNLANIYGILGNNAKAELLFERALAIRESALGPNHPDVATSLNNLAILYKDKGDYAKAEAFYQRALAIREKAFGPDHPNVAATLSNLAALYDAKHEYAKAEPFHQRGLAIWQKVLGPDHPEIATALNNLAISYRGRGEYAKAESFYQRALAIREKALGPDHPDVAQSFQNLAILRRDTGEHAKAEPLLLRALAIWEKALGPDHPYVAIALTNLAMSFAAKGDVTQAVAFQSRTNAVCERILAFNLASGSESQKLAYLATLAGQADHTVSLHLRFAPTDPAARDLAVAVILQRKGRVLDAVSDSLSALRRRFQPQDQALLDQWKDSSAQLAGLVLGGPQRMSLAEHQKRIKYLEEQKERLEAQISRHSTEFGAQSRPITVEAVQSAIPAEAALIEFTLYHPFNPKYTKPDEQFGSPRYAAYVLRRQGGIQWAELGEAKAIEEAIASWRKALRDPKRRDIQQQARAVDRLVMQPLRPLLGQTTKLLLSPDGALNLIPFAALADERNQFLVERYSMSYLTSGRDLLRLQAAGESKGQPAIFANPAFGDLALAATPQNQNSSPGTAAAQAAPPRVDPGQVFFQPLPGTAREGRELKALLPQAAVFTGERATETALKQVNAPKILHIATHGFFMQEDKANTENTRGSLPLDDAAEPTRMARWAVTAKDPLLRSGLALAGANQGKSGEDDGVLTAMEATGLDLWGTKLVVLSACNTGLGDVRNSEGVYGLRRALALAGAESLVMSLWQVPDDATKEMMVAYYKSLQAGQGRGEALRQVQLRMLRSKVTAHPFYWASFIQSGEWASLEGKR